MSCHGCIQTTIKQGIQTAGHATEIVVTIGMQITKHAKLNRKQVDDVLGGEEAWKNVAKTDSKSALCFVQLVIYWQCKDFATSKVLLFTESSCQANTLVVSYHWYALASKNVAKTDSEVSLY